MASRISGGVFYLTSFARFAVVRRCRELTLVWLHFSLACAVLSPPMIRPPCQPPSLAPIPRTPFSSLSAPLWVAFCGGVCMCFVFFAGRQ